MRHDIPHQNPLSPRFLFITYQREFTFCTSRASFAAWMSSILIMTHLVFENSFIRKAKNLLLLTKITPEQLSATTSRCGNVYQTVPKYIPYCPNHPLHRYVTRRSIESLSTSFKALICFFPLAVVYTWVGNLLFYQTVWQSEERLNHWAVIELHDIFLKLMNLTLPKILFLFTACLSLTSGENITDSKTSN